MSLTNEEVQMLQAAVAATSNSSVIYANTAQAATLLSQNLIEGNPALVDTAGNIAYRATAAGIAAAQNYAASASLTHEQKTAAVAASHPGFAKGNGFVIPAKASRKGVAIAKKYDLDTLELNGWIFVPATAEMPKPKKSLASTISAANRKYATGFTPARHFRTFYAEKDQAFGDLVAPAEGAYIVRVEPPALKPQKAPKVAGGETPPVPPVAA